MADPLKKVQAGEKLAIGAEAYNSFVDAARDVKARKHNRTNEADNLFRQSGIIRVKNTAGEARARFEVLALDGPIIDPDDSVDGFKQQVALTGVTPEKDNHEGKFAILLEPLAEDAIGKAVVSGVVQAHVQMDDPEHQFADITDGDCATLTSTTQGAAQILWVESTTGSEPQWAVVRLSNLASQPEIYLLRDCRAGEEDTKPDLYVSNDLEDQVGKVVKLGDTCYQVSGPVTPEGCTNATCVVIDAVYPSCEYCDTPDNPVCYRLTNCDDEEDVIITNTNLSSEIGKVVVIGETCYTVEKASNCSGNQGSVGIVGLADDCEYCSNPTLCIELTDCKYSGHKKYVYNDLSLFEGFVVELDDGSCWIVGGPAAPEACAEAHWVYPVDLHESCSQCAGNCYKITNCADSEDVHYTRSITDTRGSVFKTGATCYRIEKVPDSQCSSPEEFTADAYFSSCADCAKCYQFTPCPGVEGPGFKCTNYFQPGKVYKTESGDCFTASVADNCLGAVNDCVFVAGPYEGCEVCNGTAKFLLCPADCATEDGCCDQAEPPDPNDPSSGCICTTQDLSGSVGKLVKVGGKCYSVSRDDAFTGDCEASVSAAGPFATCDDCLKHEQTFQRTFVGCPSIEGNALVFPTTTECVRADGTIANSCKGPVCSISLTDCAGGGEMMMAMKASGHDDVVQQLLTRVARLESELRHGESEGK